MFTRELFLTSDRCEKLTQITAKFSQHAVWVSGGDLGQACQYENIAVLQWALVHGLKNTTHVSEHFQCPSVQLKKYLCMRTSSVLSARVTSSPEGAWWAAKTPTRTTLSHNATEWSSWSCPKNIQNSEERPEPLRITPERQRESPESLHSRKWQKVSDTRRTTHHFLWISHQLDFTESRIHLLHAVTSPPAAHVHNVFQRSREQPDTIQTSKHQDLQESPFQNHIKACASTSVCLCSSSRWQCELLEPSPWTPPAPPSTAYSKTHRNQPNWAL